MKTVYVQHLLKVLIEEFEDVEFMLHTLEAESPSKKDSERIRMLLDQLGKRNAKLLDRFGV